MFKKYIRVVVGVIVLAAISYGATKTQFLSSNNPVTGAAVTAVTTAAMNAVTGVANVSPTPTPTEIE